METLETKQVSIVVLTKLYDIMGKRAYMSRLTYIDTKISYVINVTF